MAVSESDTGADSFVSWREFLTSAFAPSLALVCLAVWLHAADGLILATMLPSTEDEAAPRHWRTFQTLCNTRKVSSF